MHTETLLVTPAIAQKWLRNNASNRRLSPYIVKSYAKQMAAGEWVLTHQGIAFDDDDQLKDGQHRLQAVVDSGAEVLMSVTWGVSDAAFDRMDVGFKRQAGHLLGTYGALVAGAARLLGDWPVLKQAPAMTVHQVMSVAAERPTIRERATTAQYVYQKTGVSPSIHLAVLAVAATTAHSHKIESWVDGLVSGAGLAPTDPRLHVRNRWAVRSKQLNAARTEAAYLLTRAWNAYAQGEPVSLIKWSPNYSPIPVVGGEK